MTPLAMESFTAFYWILSTLLFIYFIPSAIPTSVWGCIWRAAIMGVGVLCSGYYLSDFAKITGGYLGETLARMIHG